jgi:hypothetical protein
MGIEEIPVVANAQKSFWLVMACAAFVAQVVPQTWTGDCDRGCCAAQEPDCCAIPLAPPLSTARVGSAKADTGCPLCAATTNGRLAHTDQAPCHCQLDARQEQSLAVSSDRSSQRDELPVWGEVVDTTSPGASQGLGIGRDGALASLSIPIRPVRILYGVWRN